MLHVACRCAVSSSLVIATVFCSAPATAAETYTLEEPATDTRARQVHTDVRMTGKAYFNAGGGKTISNELAGTAVFRYRERRLAPGGRDAEALRAVREFDLATSQTRVGDYDSGSELPAHLRLIVASGQREGVQSYCPEAPLTREAADLLELPGDPLGLTALLPRTAVEVGAEWKVSDWSAQLLATIEALDKSELACQLASVSGDVARIEFRGKSSGQRFGANAEVELSGALQYDVRQRLIRGASTRYAVKSSIGTINPGIDATFEATIERSLARSPGRLTDALAESIPATTPPAALHLVYDAPPWGARFRHDRNWHVFRAVLEGTPRVVILRMMERGSVICQCNVSPVPAAPAGQHTPVEQFEADIKEALGERFQAIAAREKVPMADGRTILRVVTQGQTVVAGAKPGESATLPMAWIYYLVADRSGKQLSFVFVVEPAYLPALGDRDLQMVKSVELGR